MLKRQQLLKRIPLLRGFSNRSLKELANLAREQHFDYGLGICQWFDNLPCYVIAKGEVHVRDINGERTLKEDDVLNEGALVDPTKPCNMHATSSGSLGVDLVALSGIAFQEFLGSKSSGRRKV